MTMTKRHYEQLAKAICETMQDETFADATVSATRISAVRATAERIADVLASDNPRFHRSRFLDACGFAVEYTDPPAPSWQGDPTLGGRRERRKRAYVPRHEQPLLPDVD